MRPLWSMSIEVGLTQRGSEAQRVSSRPSETLKDFSAFSGGSWAPEADTTMSDRIILMKKRRVIGSPKTRRFSVVHKKVGSASRTRQTSNEWAGLQPRLRGFRGAYRPA